MRTSLAVMIAVAACHAPPPAGPVDVANTTPAATPVPAPSAKLPLLYADLFVDGATWTFPATAEKRHRDEFGVEYASDTVHGTITCRISHAMVIRGGKRAQLDCAADQVAFPLTNPPNVVLVGTADGLWEAPWEFNNDIASLDPRFIMLPPHPTEGRREIIADDFSQAIEIHKVGGGYCYIHRADGEWEGWQLCVRAGDGVIGGAGFYLGAGAELFQFGEHYQL